MPEPRATAFGSYAEFYNYLVTQAPILVGKDGEAALSVVRMQAELEPLKAQIAGLNAKETALNTEIAALEGQVGAARAAAQRRVELARADLAAARNELESDFEQVLALRDLAQQRYAQTLDAATESARALGDHTRELLAAMEAEKTDEVPAVGGTGKAVVFKGGAQRRAALRAAREKVEAALDEWMKAETYKRDVVQRNIGKDWSETSTTFAEYSLAKRQLDAARKKLQGAKDALNNVSTQAKVFSPLSDADLQNYLDREAELYNAFEAQMRRLSRQSGALQKAAQQTNLEKFIQQREAAHQALLKALDRPDTDITAALKGYRASIDAAATRTKDELKLYGGTQAQFDAFDRAQENYAAAQESLAQFADSVQGTREQVTKLQKAAQDLRTGAATLRKELRTKQSLIEARKTPPAPPLTTERADRAERERASAEAAQAEQARMERMEALPREVITFDRAKELVASNHPEYERLTEVVYDTSLPLEERAAAAKAADEFLQARQDERDATQNENLRKAMTHVNGVTAAQKEVEGLRQKLEGVKLTVDQQRKLKNDPAAAAAALEERKAKVRAALANAEERLTGHRRKLAAVLGFNKPTRVDPAQLRKDREAMFSGVLEKRGVRALERGERLGPRAIGPVTRPEVFAPREMRTGSEESRAGETTTQPDTRLKEALGVRQRDVPMTRKEQAEANMIAAENAVEAAKTPSEKRLAEAQLAVAEIRYEIATKGDNEPRAFRLAEAQSELEALRRTRMAPVESFSKPLTAREETVVAKELAKEPEVKGKRTPEQNVDGFLKSLKRITKASKKEKGLRAFGDVDVDVKKGVFPGPDKSAYISLIRNNGVEGKGAASTALKKLMALADKHGVTLTLQPEKVGAKGLSTEQLEAWYAKSGFKSWDGGMYREPKTSQDKVGEAPAYEAPEIEILGGPREDVFLSRGETTAQPDTRLKEALGVRQRDVPIISVETAEFIVESALINLERAQNSKQLREAIAQKEKVEAAIAEKGASTYRKRMLKVAEALVAERELPVRIAEKVLEERQISLEIAREGSTVARRDALTKAQGEVAELVQQQQKATASSRKTVQKVSAAKVRSMRAVRSNLRGEADSDETPALDSFVDRQGDVFFSRGETAAPSTTATVRAELGKVFPDLGRVQIYDSVDALVQANPQYKGRIPADARGFVDSAGNKAFLIAENIDQGRALGVLLHEVGSHIGLKNTLGDAQYNALVKAVQTWAKKTDGSPEAKVAQAALARVEAAQTPASQRADETLAYAVEEAVNAGVKPMETKSVLGQWLSRVAQLFRRALEKFGLPPKALDAQGLVDMAFGAAKMEMRGMRPAGAAPKRGELLFSRKTDYTPGLATAGKVSEQLVGGQRSFVDKVKANLLGFRAQVVDKLAPLEKVAYANMDDMKASQLMFYMRMYDQRNHFTSEALATGVPERKEITRADGRREFVIESKPGANIKQIVDRLSTKAVVKAAGSVDAANRLFTLYTAAKRADRVGYQKLGFGRAAAEAELRQIDIELRAPTLDPNDRKRLTQRKDYLEKNVARMPSEADIRAAVKEIEADKTLRDAFEDAREMYNEYNRNLLSFAVQAGAVSDAEAKRLLAAKDYVPYYRVRGGNAELVIGGENPIRIGNLKDNPQLEELVGGEEPIFDFLTSSVQNTSMLLDMSLRNLAVKNAMHELRDVGLAKVYSERNEKGKRRSVPDNAVKFRVKGEDWFAVVNTDAAGVPSDLLVKGLAGIPTMLPAAVRMMAVPARILRRAIVASPVYVARQVVRDSVSAALASGANMTPILSSLRKIGKKGALDARGVTGGQVFTGMPEDMARLLREMQTGRPGWAKAWSMMERTAMEADATTRRAQYDSYREQGLSEMEATLAALESMNFSRRGLSPSVHFANAIIPFFNAQIQGLDVLYRSLWGQMPFDKRLDIRNKLLKRGALLFMTSLAYAAAMQDEEEYKNARPDEKYGNWFLRMPFLDEYADEPVVVRVPVPFELGYIFKSLPEALVNTMASEEGGKEALQALKQIAINTIPGGSSMPQLGGVPVPVPLPAAVKPLIEVSLGRSFFTGRDIESVQEQQLEPGARSRDSTSEVAKAVGETFNISPVKMEYLIRGYTGSLGVALMQSLNFLAPAPEGSEKALKRMSELPVVGTVFQPMDAGGIIDATYARVNEIRQAQATYEDMLTKGRTADAQAYLERKADELALASVAGDFRKRMGDVTKAERAIREAPSLSAQEKRERLNELRQVKIQIASAARAIFDRKTPQAAPA